MCKVITIIIIAYVIYLSYNNNYFQKLYVTYEDCIYNYIDEISSILPPPNYLRGLILGNANTFYKFIDIVYNITKN